MDEIQQLDAILLSTLETSKTTQEKIDEQIVILNEQQKLLKKQLLQLILSGEYPERINQKAELLNIEFPGPYYCVLTVKNLSDQKMDDDKVIDSVENLSDNNLYFYALKLEAADYIAVLLSLAEPSQVNDAIELMNALEDAIGMSFEIGRGEVCDNIKSIPISLIFALSNENADLTKDESIAGGRVHSVWYNETLLKRMASAVKNLNLPEALAVLEEYFEDLQADYPSILAQCGIVSDVINTIIRLSMDLGAPLPEKSAGAILILQNTQEFKNEIKKLLTQLVTQLEQNKQDLIADQTREVKDYLLNHALEYEMSIEKMAKDMGMSIKQINGIIKSETGYTYKDYLITLRMEAAKKFLVAENLSVTETSERVGYAKVSYFICTFKNYTGYTPANYKSYCATHTGHL